MWRYDVRWHNVYLLAWACLFLPPSLIEVFSSGTARIVHLLPPDSMTSWRHDVAMWRHDVRWHNVTSWRQVTQCLLTGMRLPLPATLFNRSVLKWYSPYCTLATSWQYDVAMSQCDVMTSGDTMWRHAITWHNVYLLAWACLFLPPSLIEVFSSGTARIVHLLPPDSISWTTWTCNKPWTFSPFTCVMRCPARRPASNAGLLGSTAWN